MSAASDVRDDLLSLIGAAAMADVNVGGEARMLADLNAARTFIFSQAPDSWFSEDDRAEIIRAPTTVTLDNVTANSKAITFTAFVPTWQLGCTIVIAGDTTQNRLVLSGSSVSLLKPYTGSTAASVSATIYQDVILPGSDVEQVMLPVMLEGERELWPLDHERTRQAISAGNGRSYPLAFADRPIRLPYAFLTERSAVSSTGVVNLALRFDSLPDQASRLAYKVKLRPAAVASFADTRTELVPFGYKESILYPIVRYKFASWPHFTGSQKTLKDDYDAALAMLATLNPRGFQETSVEVGEDW